MATHKPSPPPVEIEMDSTFLKPPPPALNPTRKKSYFDETSGHHYLVDAESGQSTWLGKVVVGPNMLVGTSIVVTIPSGNPIYFAVPWWVVENDELLINSSGKVICRNGMDFIEPSKPAPPDSNYEQKVIHVASSANYLDQLMADDAMDGDYCENDLLYEASWHTQDCCRGDDATAENVSANSSREPNVVIKVSDRNVTITQRNEMMPSCCDGIDLCKCPQIKTTKIDTSAIHAVIASEKSVTCCTYIVTYMVWFFCGLCGGHYWLHKKRFRQTKAHRAFLCCWCLTCGCGCIPCCIDAYRIYFWLQSYTIKLYGEYEEDTIILDVKNKTILQKIRDSVYRAMSPDRQIDGEKPTVSYNTCDDQEDKAANEKIVESVAEGCFCLPQKKTKIVVSKDRLIMHKYNQNGNKHEWTDIFLIDVQGVEQSSPPEYPMWYVWLYCFPPLGLCGGHRHKLGQRGIGLYLYCITLGFFGLGYIFDFFTMLFCVHNLKIKDELKMVVKDAEDLEFQMKLKKPADGKKLVNLVNTEMKRAPQMSKSNEVGRFHHVQHPALMDCCKDWFDNTVRDTKVDALSISVHQVHKTKLKKIHIPMSACCPICCLFRPCVCMCCTCCYVSTTDIVDQEMYHKTAGRVSNVNSMPNSSFNNLFKCWLFCGLFGGHRFKSRHAGMGKLYLALWFVVVFCLIFARISFMNYNYDYKFTGSCSANYDCNSNNCLGGQCCRSSGRQYDRNGEQLCTSCNSFGDCGTCKADSYLYDAGNSNFCLRCDRGKTSPAGSTDVSQCKTDINLGCSGDSECSSGSCIQEKCACAENYYASYNRDNDKYQCIACDPDLNSPAGSTSSSDCTNNQPGMYKKRASGNCGDGGGDESKITSAAACGEAAAALGLGDTTAGTRTTLGYPPGCSYSSGTLSFNTQNPNVACSSDRECVCAIACQPNTYQDQSGQTSCKTCPPGKVQPQAGKNHCFPGSRRGCSENFYKSNSECVACADGWSSPAGSTSSSDCSYSPNQAGIYKERTDGNCGDSGGGWGKITSAIACEAGAAAFGWSDTTATTESKASSWPPACYFYNGNLLFNTENPNYNCQGNEKCLCTLTCQPDTYQDQSGQTSCKACPAGQSQPMAGKSDCATNRRLLNTQLKGVGGGPSIVKPQTIQTEQPNTYTERKQVQKHRTKVNTNNAAPATKEIEHLTNTSCTCPPQQSFGTIIETYIPEKLRRLLNGRDSSYSSAGYSSSGYWAATIFYDIVIGLIFSLWFYDLFRLRSMLDTTTVEFVTSSGWFSSELWDKEWECYLNSNEEAEQMIALLNKFTASYQKEALTFKQVIKINEEEVKKTQRVRRRSSKSSRELMLMSNPMK